VRVGVGVLVCVCVNVGVRVGEGVRVLVGVILAVMVRVGVRVRQIVDVLFGVVMAVGLGEDVIVEVGVATTIRICALTKSGAIVPPLRFPNRLLLIETVVWPRAFVWKVMRAINPSPCTAGAGLSRVRA
jgi:hypothetical protein